MEKEYLNGLMAEFMKVIMNQIKGMASAISNGQMDVSIMGSGMKEICMELENIKGKMDFGNKVNGKKDEDFLNDNIFVFDENYSIKRYSKTYHCFYDIRILFLC